MSKTNMVVVVVFVVLIILIIGSSIDFFKQNRHAQLCLEQNAPSICTDSGYNYQSYGTYPAIVYCYKDSGELIKITPAKHVFECDLIKEEGR